MGVNFIEESSPKKHKLEVQKEPVLSDYEQSEEEKAYLQFIHEAATDGDILLEDWHEPMGHSLSSKSQLNVYLNIPADLECYASMATILRPTKKAKTQPTLSTITIGILHTKKNNFKLKHQRKVKILFDTGCGATLIHHSVAGKLSFQTDRLSNWSTKAGSFRATKTCK